MRREAFGGTAEQAISLDVNGARKQASRLTELVWSVPELVVHLSTLYRLGPGDLIYTGTPAGVGPVGPGDRLLGKIDGLPDLALTITEPERS